MGVAEPVLRGTYTLVLSPTDKVYAAVVRDEAVTAPQRLVRQRAV